MKNRTCAEVGSYWDSDPWHAGKLRFWTQLSAVQNRLSVKESGRPDNNWVDYTLATHLAGKIPLKRCLSLGCGRGAVERQWAERGAFESCDAYDISPVSIAEAAKIADEAGLSSIRYAVTDINQIELAPSSYDAAWTVASAHHFDRLEHIFGQVARALKPGGVLILHEYVGANRFQFDARQREVIDACLHLLPMKYRRLIESATSDQPHQGAASQRRNAVSVSKRMMGKVRDGAFFATALRLWRNRRTLRAGGVPVKEISVPTASSVVAVDPSEAIRSADILPVLQLSFEVLEYRPLGGTILQFLLADIAGNFQDEVGERLLDVLFRLEDTLIECGDLPSDFAYIVARPRS